MTVANYTLGISIPVPHKNNRDLLRNSITILENAIHSAESFLRAYEELRSNTKGTPTDHQQDLLRAALIFSCAGVDACIKQLITDTLYEVMKKDVGARSQLLIFIKRSLLNKEKLDLELVTQALVTNEPVDFFHHKLRHQLTSDSLQSVDQILKVGQHFDINSDEIAKNKDSLKEIYKVRNQISHEMDVDLLGVNRKRRARKFIDMKKQSKEILEAGVAFVLAVEKKLKQNYLQPY